MKYMVHDGCLAVTSETRKSIGESVLTCRQADPWPRLDPIGCLATDGKLGLHVVLQLVTCWVIGCAGGPEAFGLGVIGLVLAPGGEMADCVFGCSHGFVVSEHVSGSRLRAPFSPELPDG